MRVQYDKEVDAVYLYLQDSVIPERKVARSEEVLPGVVSDYDDKDNILGIEILSVRSKTREDLKPIYSLLTEEQMEEFRQFYRQQPA